MTRWTSTVSTIDTIIKDVERKGKVGGYHHTSSTKFCDFRMNAWMTLLKIFNIQSFERIIILSE
jgi:alpha-N-acetylglucosamine transferase